MSQVSQDHPAFASGRILAAMLAVALAMWVSMRGVWPLFVSDAAGEVGRAIDAAVLVAGAGAIVGLAPVALLAGRGVMATIWGYFAGAFGRVVVAVLGIVVAAGRGELPVAVMAVALLATYLPLLAVEAGLVGRYLWRLDAADTASAVCPAVSAKGNA